jgi:hypothetical protein
VWHVIIIMDELGRFYEGRSWCRLFCFFFPSFFRLVVVRALVLLLLFLIVRPERWLAKKNVKRTGIPLSNEPVRTVRHHLSRPKRDVPMRHCVGLPQSTIHNAHVRFWIVLRSERRGGCRGPPLVLCRAVLLSKVFKLGPPE